MSWSQGAVVPTYRVHVDFSLLGLNSWTKPRLTYRAKLQAPIHFRCGPRRGAGGCKHQGVRVEQVKGRRRHRPPGAAEEDRRAVTQRSGRVLAGLRRLLQEMEEPQDAPRHHPIVVLSRESGPPNRASFRVVYEPHTYTHTHTCTNKRLIHPSLQDFAFYGLGLNNILVLNAIGYASGPDLFTQLLRSAVGTVILSVAGSLPGYLVAILTIDTVGRRALQVLGFLVLTILFCVLGFAPADALSPPARLALYAAAQFFFDLGPNTTTFVVPAECFPTRYRAAAHGLSAAAGKLGAIAAQLVSIPLLTSSSSSAIDADASSSSASPDYSPRLAELMRLFALFMLCGTVVSLALVPETKGLTLEELAGEPPTSYDAGRNGSVSLAPADALATRRRGRQRWRRLLVNPFLGGKPAGFAYPRAPAAGEGRGGWWSRSARGEASMYAVGGGGGSGGDVEMAADSKPMPVRHKGGWWRRRRHHGGPGENMSRNRGMSMNSTSSSTRVFRESADVARPSTVSVPKWNAGWGRVDRGAAPDNIHLHDVGGLID